MREYDLTQHLELTHGWNVDDINDRLVEEAALAGEDFWIGGDSHTIEESTPDLQAEELRQSLTHALNFDHGPMDSETTVGSGQAYSSDGQRGYDSFAEDADMFEKPAVMREEMDVIDPALAHL